MLDQHSYFIAAPPGLSPRRVKVYHLRIGRAPEVAKIVNDLQSLVGLLNNGYMESIALTTRVTLLVDKDGIRKALPPNTAPRGHGILGPAVLVRADRYGNVDDVTENDIALLREHIQAFS